MRLIVFDLDHTLLAANSSFRFGSFLYRKKFFSLWQLLAGVCDYARHKWLGMSIQALHSKSFKRLFQGCALAEISRYVDQFLTDQLTSLYYLPVLQRLKAAQEQGDKVVILSSSPDFLAGKIAQRLQVNSWKATTYQVDEEGALVAISHVMEGKDKACYVKELADQMQLPLSAVTVYSDSYLDLPVLKIAGQPIGVMPDHRLRRICLQNGWEVL